MQLKITLLLTITSLILSIGNAKAGTNKTPSYITEINRCTIITSDAKLEPVDVFYTCLFKALYLNPKYVQDLDRITEAKELLFVEQNVLDAFKKANTPSAMAIREQAKIVLGLEKELNQIKLDFYMKFLRDEEYRDFIKSISKNDLE